MSFVRAAAVLVLIAGCGAGQKQPQPAPPAAAAAHTAQVPAPSQATVPEAEAPAPPAAPPPETSGAEPPPATAPWRDCGRILSPFNRRPQRVEALTFDCRAARRVAVRYLRNGSLPEGWGQADCAASRAACEQGGWGFRLVKG